MDRVLVVSRRPRSRRKDGGTGVGVRLVETSVETSSGEGVDSRKNLGGGRSWVAAKGDGVVLLCDGGDPWSVCNLL